MGARSAEALAKRAAKRNMTVEEYCKAEKRKGTTGDAASIAEKRQAAGDRHSGDVAVAGAVAGVEPKGGATIAAVLGYRQYLGSEQWRVRWTSEPVEESWERAEVLDAPTFCVPSRAQAAEPLPRFALPRPPVSEEKGRQGGNIALPCTAQPSPARPPPAPPPAARRRPRP